MEPDDFLTREEYEALDDMERLAYLERVVAEADRAKQAGDEYRQVDFATHVLDLSKWTMTPEDYERSVERKFWDAAMENAEKIREIFVQASTNPDLTEEERADAAERLPALEAMIEHKRDLAGLPEQEQEN